MERELWITEDFGDTNRTNKRMNEKEFRFEKEQTIAVS
jgi:hypothetical protein